MATLITRSNLRTLANQDLLRLQPPVKGHHASSAQLPATGNAVNDCRLTGDLHTWQWNGSVWNDSGFYCVSPAHLMCWISSDIAKNYLCPP
jgi:hypothetical protein